MNLIFALILSSLSCAVHSRTPGALRKQGVDRDILNGIEETRQLLDSNTPSISAGLTVTSTPTEMVSTYPSATTSLSPTEAASASPTDVASASPTGVASANPTDTVSQAPSSSSSPTLAPTTQAPTPECDDLDAYRSPFGLACRIHSITDCLQWRHVGLSEEAIVELLWSCPVSCNVPCG